MSKVEARKRVQDAVFAIAMASLTGQQQAEDGSVMVKDVSAELTQELEAAWEAYDKS